MVVTRQCALRQTRFFPLRLPADISLPAAPLLGREPGHHVRLHHPAEDAAQEASRPQGLRQDQPAHGPRQGRLPLKVADQPTAPQGEHSLQELALAGHCHHLKGVPLQLILLLRDNCEMLYDFPQSEIRRMIGILKTNGMSLEKRHDGEQVG